jgi:trehalose/maltose hydrolase-like predicted phosphorylase
MAGVYNWKTVPSPVDEYVNGTYASPQMQVLLLGDTPRSVNLPSWTDLGFNDGQLYFDTQTGTIEKYFQMLDMKKGCMQTSIQWNDNGRVTDLNTTVFVSRDNPHTGVVKYSVRPHWSGIAAFSSTIDGTSDKAGLATCAVGGITDAPEIISDYMRALNYAYFLYGEQYIEQEKNFNLDNNAMWLVEKTTQSDIEVAMSAVMDFENVSVIAAVPDISTPDKIGLNFMFEVESGKEYTCYKYVSFYTSMDSLNPVEDAKTSAAQLKDEGYDKTFKGHCGAWSKIWDTDVIIGGDAEGQKAIRANLFYLYQSFREDVNWSASPMGLSGLGYNGHVFWDADVWMYPTLLITHPEFAESVVMYRYNMLQGAISKAKESGYEGAMYPWESADKGSEVTPTWATTGSYEHHITADVALAQWDYYLATGDLAWLRDFGSKVICETAKYWASRVTYNQNADRYEITGVTGPDEYHENINNNAYTNAAAAKNLRIAAKTCEILGIEYPSKWLEIADRMYIPFDDQKQVHLEYEGYAGDQIKQADAVMLTYPLDFEMSDAVRLNDLLYYANLTDPNGPGMTDSIHSIVAAELGNVPMAYDYFVKSYRQYVKPPFNMFSETPTNYNFCFLTGAGGSLQSTFYGFLGFRWNESAIDLKPVPTLPENWTGITYKGIKWQGHLANIAIKPNQVEITINGGNSQNQEQSAPVKVVIWNHAFDAKMNHTYAVTLDGNVKDLSEKANNFFGVPGFNVTLVLAGICASMLLVSLGRKKD